ncbi:MAG TPA: M64 family metallopeptidase [Salinivirga sp.]|uniref:M64 family metallopeptidase n=1 Tax=Salinivirga sp. TaxID=1970192 RepID=UPI002B489BAC|nr:M64 family metallopeptidase [Salinivirga sp.]HKK58716.1 M64 family metallopeptidase [Salinivirga sp.]
MNRVFPFLLIIFTSILAHSLSFAQGHKDFDLDRALRIDFILTGEKDWQKAGILRLKEEQYWSGTEQSLIWPFQYGTYQIEVYNESNELILKQGFSTLFEEWQSTGLPRDGAASFEQSYSIPYPKGDVLVKLLVRNKNKFELLNTWSIDPDADNIKQEPVNQEAILILGGGDYRNKLDLVFLADGYSESELKKAKKDARRFGKFLFRNAPFNKYRRDINIWLVHKPSIESGTDEPCKGVFKKTALGTSFNTLNLKRYLSVEEFFKVKDVAAAAPYDFILVMVNTKRYGGGGVFNHFSVFSADGPSAEKVFLHEFGHHFGGLADEYFNSEVTYEDMLDTTIEPWQPNITTLVDFDSKWPHLISEGLPVPTPRIAKFENYTGVFEGGAYLNKGVFSPAMDCRMRTNKAKDFCTVCQLALEKMLLIYTSQNIE